MIQCEFAYKVTLFIWLRYSNFVSSWNISRKRKWWCIQKSEVSMWNLCMMQHMLLACKIVFHILKVYPNFMTILNILREQQIIIWPNIWRVPVKNVWAIRRQFSVGKTILSSLITYESSIAILWKLRVQNTDRQTLFHYYTLFD